MKPMFAQHISDMLCAVQQAHEFAPGSTMLALVDGALIHRLPEEKRRAWRAKSAISLLREGVAQTAQTVGPLLFELPASQLGVSAINSLIDESATEMIGSVLLTTQSAVDVQHALRNFIDVRLDGGAEMVLRFYDARILPFWLHSLEFSHRALLGQSMSHWLYWDTDWGVKCCHFNGSGALNAHTAVAAFPIQLSGEQETALLDASLPYMIMGRLRQDHYPGLDAVPLNTRYAFMRRQLVRAREHGLVAVSDLEAYCSLAISLGASFDNDRAMAIALQRLQAGSTWSDVICALTADDWKRMQEKAR